MLVDNKSISFRHKSTINMNNTLTLIEEDAFMEIINIGLSKSADAMSLMLNENVFIKCVQRAEVAEAFKSIKDDSFQIINEINGDVNGVCCFVFTKKDAMYLTRNNRIEKLAIEEYNLNKQDEAFLIELDNIIVAAVTTQIANFLQININRDIPRLGQWNSPQNLDRLLKKYDPLFFKTRFRTSDVTTTPGFYWFIESSINENIKNFVRPD